MPLLLPVASVLIQPSRPTAPPQIIFLDQPYDWTSTAVNILQFLMLAGLTYYIFRKQYRQKTMERHAEWYHRVVTDFAIEKITHFSENTRGLLLKIAKEILRLKTGTSRVQDPTVRSFSIRISKVACL
jgi:hypothetical protein